jgi:hypothetical protein
LGKIQLFIEECLALLLEHCFEMRP